MPNWNKILTEVEASNQVNALDRMRKSISRLFIVRLAVM